MVTGVLLLLFLHNTVNLRLRKTRKLHCHKHSPFRSAQGLQARCRIKFRVLLHQYFWGGITLYLLLTFLLLRAQMALCGTMENWVFFHWRTGRRLNAIRRELASFLWDNTNIFLFAINQSAGGKSLGTNFKLVSSRRFLQVYQGRYLINLKNTICQVKVQDLESKAMEVYSPNQSTAPHYHADGLQVLCGISQWVTAVSLGKGKAWGLSHLETASRARLPI